MKIVFHGTVGEATDRAAEAPDRDDGADEVFVIEFFHEGNDAQVPGDEDDAAHRRRDEDRDAAEREELPAREGAGFVERSRRFGRGLVEVGLGQSGDLTGLCVLEGDTLCDCCGRALEAALSNFERLGHTCR